MPTRSRAHIAVASSPDRKSHQSAISLISLISLISRPCSNPECGSCYGPFSYVVSRTFFDSITMRVLPALLCAAITYPTVGLDHDEHGAVKAYAFTAALCLANLVGSTMFNCIGIVCSSTALAVLLAVLYALFTLLFCGFLVNVKPLVAREAAARRLPSPHLACDLTLARPPLASDLDPGPAGEAVACRAHSAEARRDMLLQAGNVPM